MMYMEKKISRKSKICYLMIVIMGALAVLLWGFRDGISGNDFWWHVKAGEWMVQNKAVMKTDCFSWLNEQKAIQWTAHEWLAEVIFYLLYRYWGEQGMFWTSLGSAILLFIWLVWLNRKSFFTNCLFTAVYVVLFAALLPVFFYGRPHIFSFYLFAGELCCLTRFIRDKKAVWVFYIPGIGILWANLHGGSANLVYLLPILLLISSIPAWNKLPGAEATDLSKRERLLLLGVVLLTMSGTCINPYGVKLLIYPYSNMADSLMLSVIGEWAAPDAKNIGSTVCFFLPIFMSVIGVIFREKRLKSFDFLLMLFFAFMFLRSQRFIMLYSIATFFWCFQYVIPCDVKEVTGKLEWLALGTATVGLCVGMMFGVSNIVQMAEEGVLISRELSQQMIETVKDQNPKRLYNDYNFGGILIFHDIEVFFDGRADMYSTSGVLKDGVSFAALRTMGDETADIYVDVEKIVEKYGFDAILIEKGRALCSYLVSFPERYQLITENEKAAYFKVLGNY